MSVGKITETLSRHWWVIVLTGFVAFINFIPDNRIVALGDFYQLLSPQNNLGDYFFTWWRNAGQGLYNPIVPSWPFYLGFAAADWLGIGISYANALFVWLFFLAAYASMYYSLKRLRVHLKDIVPAEGLTQAASLLYSINIFSFSLFQYSWGINHHALIYLFMPYLLAGFFECIVAPNKKQTWIFLLFFLASTIGYNNLAWLATVLFGQLLILLSIVITRLFQKRSSWTIIGRSVLLWIAQLVEASFIIVPFWIAQSSYASSFAASAVNQLANDPINLIDLLGLHNLSGFFPNYNLYSSSFLNFITDTLIFVPWLAVLGVAIYYLLINREKASIRRVWLVLFGVLIVVSMLAMRLGEPLLSINRWIYSLPGFSLFRSAEKMHLLYVAFFYLVLALSVLTRKSRRLSWLIVLITLVLPWPLYIGGMANYVTQGHDHNNWKVLKDDGYQTAVAVPDEYREIAPIINSDRTETSVISLPYSVNNSINWSNYTKWGHLGHDPLYSLYSRPYFSANASADPSRPAYLPFESKADDPITAEEFVQRIQDFSGRYILWHKDVHLKDQAQTEHVRGLLDQLLDQGKIVQLKTNEYFDLFEVDDSWQQPIVSSSVSFSFQRVSVTQYRVFVRDFKPDDEVVFHQTYNESWRLFYGGLNDLKSCQKEGEYSLVSGVECTPRRSWWRLSDLRYIWQNEVDAEHYRTDGYANGWRLSLKDLLDNGQGSYTKNNDGSYNISFVINYEPQSYLYLCAIIIVGFMLVVRRWLNKR